MQQGVVIMKMILELLFVGVLFFCGGALLNYINGAHTFKEILGDLILASMVVSGLWWFMQTENQ